MFNFFRSASSSQSMQSPFALNRRANQIAQSQPELAIQLRMLAAYGSKKQARTSGAKAGSAASAVSNLQPHAEVRTPRIFA